MPTTRVRTGPLPPRPRHPKVTLRTETGRHEIVLPYAPRRNSTASIGRTFDQVARDGRDPLLIRSGGMLRTLDLTLLLARPDHQQPVDDWIGTLHEMARAGERVQLVGYGRHEHGWWRITSCDGEVLERQHGSNRVTRASYDLTLTRASDLNLKVGPVSGGAAPSAPKAKPSERVHVVKRGDTYWGMAVRYYGNGSKWPRIGDANPWKPTAIPIGARVKIP